MRWQSIRMDQVPEGALEQTYRTLSDSCKAHIDRFYRQEDANRSLAARYLLRQLLRQEFSLEDPRITRLENGQPVLENGKLYISMGHSRELVVCAAGELPVGIDVEQIRPVSEGLVHKTCTPEEKAYVWAAGAEDFSENPGALERFYRIWTAKEAYFKMLGTGITDLQGVNTLTLPRHTEKTEDYILCVMENPEL